MASPAPVTKKPAVRNTDAADLSPLSRAASAAAALNDDLQDVLGRPMAANPPPARMLAVLANQPTARQRVVTTAGAAEVVVPAAAAFQPAVMPAPISATAALAPVIPITVSAPVATSEASLAEARAEVMRVREQLLLCEAQLQAEVSALLPLCLISVLCLTFLWRA